MPLKSIIIIEIKSNKRQSKLIPYLDKIVKFYINIFPELMEEIILCFRACFPPYEQD